MRLIIEDEELRLSVGMLLLATLAWRLLRFTLPKLLLLALALALMPRLVMLLRLRLEATTFFLASAADWATEELMVLVVAFFICSSSHKGFVTLCFHPQRPVRPCNVH
jgi:endonuclease/exonuclease/phosphatase (EEP) superfamily protein YafD